MAVETTYTSLRERLASVLDQEPTITRSSSSAVAALRMWR